MLPFIMMAVLAVLGFLCVSHLIPALTRRKPDGRSGASADNPEPRVP